MRKFIYIFLSLAIVFSNIQSAFASAWVLQSATTAGSSAIIKATRDGLTSIVRYAPPAASVGRALALGGAGALALAVPQVLGSAVDWVMDSDNNRIKYRTPPDQSTFGYTFEFGAGADKFFSTAELACQYKYPGGPTDNTAKYTHMVGSTCYYTKYGRDPAAGESVIYKGEDPNAIDWSYKPISDFVPKVISNAAAGDTASQELIKDAAVADFNTGALDTALQENAGTKPVDPTDPTAPEQSTPFDPTDLIAAMKSLMTAIDNMSSGLKKKMDTMLVELGLMNAETNKVINESVDRIIENDNVKVGEIVAAIEAIEGNTLDGQVINDAVDKVIAEGKTNTADIVAAIEAIEGNTLDGQVINDAVDKVIANDDANAQATQDVISNSIDDAIAESHVDADTVADAVTDGATATQDAIREQTDSLTKTDPDTGEKSLALPDFCSWASSICEFTDWVKTEPQTPPDDGDIEVEKPNETMHVGILERLYIDMPAQCPADPLLEFMGAKIPFPMSVFCQFASMMKPLILLFAYIKGLSIIGNGLT